MGRGRRRDRPGANGLDDWGNYFEAKKAKLREQITESAQNEAQKLSDIFNGVTILVNGLTNPNADELKKLMAEHGGTYQVYQSSSTTHIVASNLPNVKINKLGSVPIVKPSWITDSITIGKLLDYRRYLLYTNQSSTQPKLDFPVVPKEQKITKTASDPKFLEEFYNNSRLHLIATLGAEYKQLISDWRDNSDGHFPGLEKLLENSSGPKECKTQIVMHIDMDCFFVSVGLRSHPELRGHPVAVTHARNPQINGGKERDAAIAMNLDRFPEAMEMIDGKSSMSEVASCSYEARKCGVRNGMFLGAAVKLCPNLKTISYDFEGYKEVSHVLYETIASYTLDIEAVSCDEMYVDLSNVLFKTNLSTEQFSEVIREEISKKTGCPCSTGFGANRLQARLATKKAKPAGYFHLQPQDVATYMSEIPLADLPGVGRATLQKLARLELRTCGDLQLASLAVLRKELGQKAGETIYDQARGLDNKPLNFNHERKSVSAEINYGIRFKAVEECWSFLKSLSEEVFNRLRETGMRARCVTLKLMVRAPEAPVETAKYLGHGICDCLSKSWSGLVGGPEVIFREVKGMYEKFKVDFRELRGVGIQLTKLEKSAPVNPMIDRFLQQKSTKSEVRVEEVGGRSPPRKDKGGNVSVAKFFRSSKDDASQETKRKVNPPIDLDVLNALPEDLRQEIIREYHLTPDLQKPVPPPAPPAVETPKKSPFEGRSWEAIKQSLYDWIKSEEGPSETDVLMVGEYLRQMAIDRKIETLKAALNFLHRNFSQLDCRWHRAYFGIVDLIQQGMVARYGHTMMVDRRFHCCSF